MDEAASALRLAQESKPDALASLDRQIMTLEIELASLKKEEDTFSVQRRQKVEQTLQEAREKSRELDKIWQAEKSKLQQIKNIKSKIEQAKHQLEVAQRSGEYELASRLRFSTIPDLQAQLPDSSQDAAREEGEGGMVMLHERVTSDDIAQVVARATGIPVQNLLKGDRDKLINVRQDRYHPVMPDLASDGKLPPKPCCRTRSRSFVCQRCSSYFARGAAVA